MEWSVEANPKIKDIEILIEGVNSYGRTISLSDATSIACFVRLEGQVIAGVSGRMEFSRLFINYLWVKDEYRKQGIASRLLENIEVAAKDQNCSDVFIETLLDEVAEIYNRLGYQKLVKIPNYVGTFSRWILKKNL